jgi:cell division septation protein DedD
MSRKKKGKNSSFARKLKWTTLLAVVFSGSVIMGHRLLQSDAKTPLIALSSNRQVAKDATSEAARAEVIKSEFSFYNHLSGAQSSSKTTIPNALEERVVRAAGMRLKNRPVSEPLDLEVAPADSVYGTQVEVEAPIPVAKDVAVPVQVEVAPVKVAEPVEVVPVKVAEPVEVPAAELARYTLQISTHTSRASATRELERLRAQELDAHIVTSEVNGEKVYRVRVGTFSSADELKVFQARLQADRGLSSIGVEL